MEKMLLELPGKNTCLRRLGDAVSVSSRGQPAGSLPAPQLLEQVPRLLPKSFTRVGARLAPPPGIHHRSPGTPRGA